jgi:large subunit ribosomal protein L17
MSGEVVGEEMRHRRKGRTLGRNSSHRRALLRNLASALFLTERDDMFYEGMTQADGKTAVNPPRTKGRIKTTLHKAKEVRPMIEKCITLAKKAIPHQEAADQLESTADRNSAEWKKWREGEGWVKWNQAVAPAVNLRRRAFAMLRDKDAVSILFDDVAHRFVDRTGGYTRIIQLADVRLGDAGKQAIIEFVGENDRVKKNTSSTKPVMVEDDAAASAEDEEVQEEQVDAPADDSDAAAEGSDATEAGDADEEKKEE